MKDSFYGVSECVFYTFTKYHRTILLDFNAKGRENIVNRTVRNEFLYMKLIMTMESEVNFATPKNLSQK